MYWFRLLFIKIFTNRVTSATRSFDIYNILSPPFLPTQIILISFACLLFVQLRIFGWLIVESSKTFVCVVGYWPLSGFTGSAQHKASNPNDRISPLISLWMNPGTPLQLFHINIIDSKTSPLPTSPKYCQALLAYYSSNCEFLVDWL